MKTVAVHDRPREKLERVGVSAVGDNELLAIVLGHGAARASVLELANLVLDAAGGLHGLARATPDDLRRIPGIGRARAAQLLAAIEAGRRTLVRGRRDRAQMLCARDVAELVIPQFGTRPVEQFGVVLLDTKHRVLRVSIVSVGTLDASVVHPREVFREAIGGGAAAIVLFHNHPSGDPRPSEEDVRLTKRLLAAGQLMGIDVLDHVIISETRYYSMKETRTLDE
ncbi:MAG: hypothetical protein DMF86_11740 [Acidobacteria bacterium]|nr:MAG: hypothetical protein DMF86_11740 [Acidobacteriota bacterium]